MDLQKVLEQHRKWISSESDGVRADLREANLRKANLSEANLRKADLSRVNLRKVNLRKADLSEAGLRGANLRDAVLPEGIPSIPKIDAAILAAIEAGGTLDMSAWHTCSTTHCRAGWAIHLAGFAGYTLEHKLGTSAAAALIYAASGSYPVPDWYASKNEAMADLRMRST